MTHRSLSTDPMVVCEGNDPMVVCEGNDRFCGIYICGCACGTHTWNRLVRNAEHCVLIGTL